MSKTIRLCNKINQQYFNEVLGRIDMCSVNQVRLKDGIMKGNAIIRGVTSLVQSPVQGGQQIWRKVA